MLPMNTESVSVAACWVHQNTLLLQVWPPAITTEKLVPVSAPVPPVPILKIQVSLGEPSSVSTPPVSVAAAATQWVPGVSVCPESMVRKASHGCTASAAYEDRKSS